MRVHETAFRRVAGNAYAGVGYHLDLHWNVVDESLASIGVAAGRHEPLRVQPRRRVQSHALQPLRDLPERASESRDHTLDPYDGTYLLLSWRVNPDWLGSSQASSVLYGEARTYVSLSEHRPRHVLAFWTYVHGVTTGAVPYLDLPALGYDVRDRSGRGYPQGRFRGTALVYGEVEYRFPITRRGLLGGVAFVNATTAARPSVNEPSLGVQEKGIALFDSVEPAAGPWSSHHGGPPGAHEPRHRLRDRKGRLEWSVFLRRGGVLRSSQGRTHWTSTRGTLVRVALPRRRGRALSWRAGRRTAAGSRTLRGGSR